MALSFADVQAILRSRLSEATASAWTDAELQDYLYLAELKVINSLPSDALWDIQETEDESEADIADGYVAFPAGATIEKLVNLQLRATGGDKVRLRIVEPARVSEYAATVENPVAWFQNGKLYFYPDIDSGVIQIVTFNFVPLPKEGAKLVPDRLIEYVVSWAYAMAIERESTQLSAVEKNEFYQNMRMLQEQYYNVNKLSGSR